MSCNHIHPSGLEYKFICAGTGEICPVCYDADMPDRETCDSCHIEFTGDLVERSLNVVSVEIDRARDELRFACLEDEMYQAHVVEQMMARRLTRITLDRFVLSETLMPSETREFEGYFETIRQFKRRLVTMSEITFSIAKEID